ncbi:MAG TPA: DUF4126 domain-containing protein [Thermoanaerobaculia bacterium]|jgi:uncharacterized membrane protein|nr:DUF4126 domain-containing protein [Thermoanaerobaculia bacterium]
MSAMNIVLGLLLGLGLSASTGLNTFLPLLLLSAAARFHVAGVALGDRFNWLTSDAAIVTLIIACVVELIADKIPAVDHFLDSAGTFIRPVAGAVASASVLTGLDPTVAAILGIVVGAPTSLGMHTLKAGTRVASTATTFGCANPVLSIIEDVLSFSLSVISIFIPLLVPFALALLAFVLWRVMKRVRRSTAAAGSAP